jgi:hypothetical protein
MKVICPFHFGRILAFLVMDGNPILATLSRANGVGCTQPSWSFFWLGAFKIVGGGLSPAKAASKVCFNVEKIMAA